MSVRITAAGAVAVACLAFLTAPVSACDERYIKKCERASAAAAAAAEAPVLRPSPSASPSSACRSSRRAAPGTRASPSGRARRGFAIKREAGMTLASARTRVTTLVPESALARRFRGFIDPQPIAQNAFEALRKPHWSRSISSRRSRRRRPSRSSGGAERRLAAAAAPAVERRHHRQAGPHRAEAPPRWNWRPRNPSRSRCPSWPPVEALRVPPRMPRPRRAVPQAC